MVTECKAFLAALCMGTCIAVLSCGEGSLARVRAAGVLRVGYAVEAPYAFLTPEGKVTGESPEIARRIAETIGVPHIEWRQCDFSALLPELESGSIDLIAAGLFVTPERAERVAFSLPSFLARPALLVRRGNPEALHSYRDAIRNPRVRVAVLAGAVEGEDLRSRGLPVDRLLVVPDASSGRAAVASGVADALALSAPTIRWMVLRAPSMAVEEALPFELPPGEPPARGAFAFRKADRSLLRAWNGALRDFLGSPEHLRLVSNFGFSAEDIPPASDTGSDR